MTRVDWIAAAIAVLGALSGLRRGLVATALSFGGLIAGALIGARVAPHLLHGGAGSPYTPLAGLVGALVGASLLQWVAERGRLARPGRVVGDPAAAAARLDRWFRRRRGARARARLGRGRRAAADSRRAEASCRGAEVEDPPSPEPARAAAHSAAGTARVDPFPQIAGPAPPTRPPDSRVLRSSSVRAARASVVRITAVACGFGVEGSGWVVRPHTVVTAAHVVAGGSGIRANGHTATALVVDRKQDVAILRVPGLKARALPLVNARSGDPAAILGYPVNGPFDARPGGSATPRMSSSRARCAR